MDQQKSHESCLQEISAKLQNSIDKNVHHTIPHHTTRHHTTPHLSHHTRTAIICRSPQTKFPELSWGADSGKPRFPSDGHTTPNHTKPHQTIPTHTIPHHTTPNHTIPHHTTPCISNMAPLARPGVPIWHPWPGMGWPETKMALARGAILDMHGVVWCGVVWCGVVSVAILAQAILAQDGWLDILGSPLQ